MDEIAFQCLLKPYLNYGIELFDSYFSFEGMDVPYKNVKSIDVKSDCLDIVLQNNMIYRLQFVDGMFKIVWPMGDSTCFS